LEAVDWMKVTPISFAMGWTSVFRLPIQKLVRIIDDENNNKSSIYNVLLVAAVE